MNWGIIAESITYAIFSKMKNEERLKLVTFLLVFALNI